MKIKCIAIALLSTILVSSPLMANDKDIHKPLVVTRAVDKATPAVAPETDVTEVVNESNTRGLGGGATGQARGHVIGGGKPGHTRSRGDVIVDDISVAKELDKSSPMSSPRDAASGMATGKRQHSTLDPDSDNDGLTDEACNVVDNDCDDTTSEADESAARTKGETTLGDISVVKELDKSSPRDAASGLPTGKRQHKPVSISKPVDKSSTKAAEAYIKLGDIKGEAMETAEDTSVVKELDKSSTKAASSGYLKIGDIQGESQRATEDHGGVIAGIVIGVVAADDDSSADCDDIEADDTKGQTEVCVDGHVTVLK